MACPSPLLSTRENRSLQHLEISHCGRIYTCKSANATKESFLLGGPVARQFPCTPLGAAMDKFDKVTTPMDLSGVVIGQLLRWLCRLLAIEPKPSISLPWFLRSSGIQQHLVHDVFQMTSEYLQFSASKYFKGKLLKQHLFVSMMKVVVIVEPSCSIYC